MSIYRVPTHRAQTKARPHNSVAWRKASAAWLQQYPFCVLCLARGQINERSGSDRCDTQRTLVVDHITPHRGDMNLFWDQDNWQTLCRLCHDIDKQRHEQRGGTAAGWQEMLAKEVQRTGSRAMVDAMRQHLPRGEGGVDATSVWT